MKVKNKAKKGPPFEPDKDVPMKPDPNPDPTRIEEPEKNDPTRIEPDPNTPTKPVK